MKKKTERPLAVVVCLIFILTGIFALNPDNILQHSAGVGALSFPIWLLLFLLLHKRGLFTVSEKGKELDTAVPLAALFAIVVMLVCVAFFTSSFAGISVLFALVLLSVYFVLYPLFVQKKLNTYLNNGKPHLFLSSRYSKIKRYSGGSRKANAFFQMGKWEEALGALEEDFHTDPNGAYIYHYNQAMYLLFADRFSASREAYDEFQKHLKAFPKGKVNENLMKTVSGHYCLLRAYKEEKSKESLRNYLEFLPAICSNPPTPFDEIVLHYYQGLYELDYGSVLQAMSHFDFILKTDSTTWYKEAARLEREKGTLGVSAFYNNDTGEDTF